MRITVVALLAVVAIPADVDAQFRRPRRRPPTPVPTALPPTAPVVDHVLSYRRARLAIETYPLLSVVHAPALGSTWTSVGGGSHGELRLTPWVLASLDLTASSWGSPTSSETAELGVRIMHDGFESRTRAYADARAGYMQTSNPGFTRPSDTFPGYASRGFGGVLGGGMYHELSRSFSLVTGASIMHGRLARTGPTTEASRYSFTSYRFTVGLRYNRVRQVLTSAQPR